MEHFPFSYRQLVDRLREQPQTADKVVVLQQWG